MKLLIDGDIVAYRAAASCMLSKKKIEAGQTEEESSPIAQFRAASMVESIIDFCRGGPYKMFLSGGNNFRHHIYPNYKANRRNAPKPPHLEDVRASLVIDFKAVVTDGYEADDAIMMEWDPEDTIICSNDKDFKANAWGRHYNFTVADEHKTIEYITQNERDNNFFIQMLMGDKSDNIVGPLGFDAKKKAAVFLSKHEGKSHGEVLAIAYEKAFGEDAQKWHRMNYRLLRLLRQEAELEKIYDEKERNLYPELQGEGEELPEESLIYDPVYPS